VGEVLDGCARDGIRQAEVTGHVHRLVIRKQLNEGHDLSVDPTPTLQPPFPRGGQGTRWWLAI
jgi:hypothetical protein